MRTGPRRSDIRESQSDSRSSEYSSEDILVLTRLSHNLYVFSRFLFDSIIHYSVENACYAGQDFFSAQPLRRIDSCLGCFAVLNHGALCAPPDIRTRLRPIRASTHVVFRLGDYSLHSLGGSLLPHWRLLRNLPPLAFGARRRAPVVSAHQAARASGRPVLVTVFPQLPQLLLLLLWHDMRSLRLRPRSRVFVL